MYYTYILESEKDKRFYTGYTSDLKKRITEHNSKKVKSTKDRQPLKLGYLGDLFFDALKSPKDLNMIAQGKTLGYG